MTHHHVPSDATPWNKATRGYAGSQYAEHNAPRGSDGRTTTKGVDNFEIISQFSGN